VPGKNIGVLVDALRECPGLPCRLSIVGGGGAAREAIEETARGDERIRFLGALPQPRVRQCYGESDVYLFPSQIDIFGLALVEAMGSGLAPVTSTRPGVARDLTVHEHNCLAVSDPDPSAWASAIERIVRDHDLRLALGEAAARTIRHRWTIDHACEGLFAGLRLGLLVAGKSA
jgi:glycosyltransferase involved in cell wall biosynthesis